MAEMEMVEHMRMIEISNEELLNNFLNSGEGRPWLSHEFKQIHDDIAAGKQRVDAEGDIFAETKSGKYWITTEPSISRYNKSGKYNVCIIYSVHKDSKYNETIYKTEV